MKHIRALLSLLLALCLLAVLPLSASAVSMYDGYVTGTWQVHYCVDALNRVAPVEDSFSRLIIQNNGTATYYIGSEAFEATWAYNTNLNNGYMYSFDLNYNGSSLPLPLLYSTLSSTFGQIMLRISDTVYVYEKA